METCIKLKSAEILLHFFAVNTAAKIFLEVITRKIVLSLCKLFSSTDSEKRYKRASVIVTVYLAVKL